MLGYDLAMNTLNLKKKDLDPNKLFHNLTAWFSGSVGTRRKTLWAKHGGKVEDVKKAQFIFSEDINHHDTKSLLDSEDYLIGCLTIFHAGFIDACMKQQSAHKVPVTKFIMLPPGTPSELRYIRRDVQPPSSTNTQASSKNTNRLKTPERQGENSGDSQDADPSDEWHRIPHVRDMSNAKGFMCDFIPGTDGFSVERKF